MPRISTRLDEGHVLISVEDSGPGVPAEHASTLFDALLRSVGRPAGAQYGPVQQFLDEYRTGRPGWLLLDACLPGLTGWTCGDGWALAALRSPSSS